MTHFFMSATGAPPEDDGVFCVLADYAVQKGGCELCHKLLGKKCLASVHPECIEQLADMSDFAAADNAAVCTKALDHYYLALLRMFAEHGLIPPARVQTCRRPRFDFLFRLHVDKQALLDKRAGQLAEKMLPEDRERCRREQGEGTAYGYLFKWLVGCLGLLRTAPPTPEQWQAVQVYIETKVSPMYRVFFRHGTVHPAMAWDSAPAREITLILWHFYLGDAKAAPDALGRYFSYKTTSLRYIPQSHARATRRLAAGRSPVAKRAPPAADDEASASSESMVGDDDADDAVASDEGDSHYDRPSLQGPPKAAVSATSGAFMRFTQPANTTDDILRRLGGGAKPKPKVKVKVKPKAKPPAEQAPKGDDRGDALTRLARLEDVVAELLRERDEAREVRNKEVLALLETRAAATPRAPTPHAPRPRRARAKYKMTSFDADAQ
jgi:hypothetical protein